MVGPRQVGKTTLAKQWLAGHEGRYLNWDIAEDRSKILKKDFLPTPAVVLDELHKFAKWKSFLKGLYDQEHEHMRAVITGSARLDIFQRGGDSLLGRYEHLRLHPFSIGECIHNTCSEPPDDWLTGPAANVELKEDALPETWALLEKFSGFPEPFTKQDSRQKKRWTTRRRELLIREDLRELTQVKTISLVEQLALFLPERVGSPLSINSLKVNLQVAHDTVSSWLMILERLYYCFRISPFFKKIARSVRKEQKLYLYDWSEILDPAARFENMVASHLLKAVNLWTDLGYDSFDLNHWRDQDGREVDFIVTRNRRPVAAIECKLSDKAPSPSLIRLESYLPGIALIQLVRDSGVDRRFGKIRIVSADKHLVGAP